MKIREHPLRTSHVFWPFLTYLRTYPVILYNVLFWELSWTPLPTLISDVINGRSLREIKNPVPENRTRKWAKKVGTEKIKHN